MNEIEINVSRMPWVPDNDTYKKIREAILWKHEHSNKTVLDLISSEKIEETDYLKIGENILAFRNNIPSALTTDDISSVFSEKITGPINRYLNSEGLKNYHEMYVVSAIEKATHTHENADVLEKLADDNGTLKYNGNPIGGSTEIKVKSFPAFEASDIYDGDTNKEVVGLLYKTNETENPLPENSIVVDVGIVLTDGTEIKRKQMGSSDGFGLSVVEFYNVPVYDENYEAFLVFRVINFGTSIQNTPLYETILMGEGYSHINIYYI